MQKFNFAPKIRAPKIGMQGLVIGLAAGFVVGCGVGAVADDVRHSLPERPAGSNEVMKATLTSVEGIEVLISDVVVPPHSGLSKHYHPGEEFAYMIDGSVMYWHDGAEETLIKAGEASAIPKELTHSIRTGDEPARIIVFRVHPTGQPERVLVED